MNRRRVLVAAGVVLAGCSGSGGSDTPRPATAEEETTATETATATASPTATETPHRPARAESRIDAARSHLDTAVAEYRRAVDDVRFAADGPRFDRSRTTAALNEARDDLTAALADAAPAQRETVETLQTYTAAVDGLVGTTDALVRSLDRRSRAITYEENDRYERAVDRLEVARSTLDEARSEFTAADDAFRSVQSRIPNPDAVAAADLRSSLDRVDRLLGGLDTVYTGDLRLERGVMDYDQGLEDFRNEDYALAASTFDDARSQFLRAENRFAEGESDAPSELLDLVLRRQCQTDGFARAAEQMNRASVVAQSDRDAARDHVEAAEAALNEAC